MENSPPEKQTVRVTILSRSYTLRTAGTSEQVEALAASVDGLLLSIAGKVPDADTTRIAVLGCLHLADKVRELENEIARIDEMRRTLDEKAARVSGLVDQLLAAGEEPSDPVPAPETEVP